MHSDLTLTSDVSVLFLESLYSILDWLSSCSQLENNYEEGHCSPNKGIITNKKKIPVSTWTATTPKNTKRVRAAVLPSPGHSVHKQAQTLKIDCSAV